MSSVSGEVWLVHRDAYTFSWNDRAGVRWTFLVSRQSLWALAGDGEEALPLSELFDRNRTAIYLAARRRMRHESAQVQQALSGEEILASGARQNFWPTTTLHTS